MTALVATVLVGGHVFLPNETGADLEQPAPVFKQLDCQAETYIIPPMPPMPPPP